MTIELTPEQKKLLRGIIVCKRNGKYLLDLIFDDSLDPSLLSSFVGALSLFGEEGLGKIEEIQIKGLDIEMVIITKYDIILIAIMDKDFLKFDIRQEAEKTLDMFYSLYKNEIEKAHDTSKFSSFKEILKSQIKDYFEKIEDKEDKRDFGFFTEIINRMKETQQS